MNFAREYMAENKTIQDKDLDVPCKHKNHTSLKHIGLKLACQDSSCKRPFSETGRQFPTISVAAEGLKEMCFPAGLHYP